MNNLIYYREDDESSHWCRTSGDRYSSKEATESRSNCSGGYSFDYFANVHGLELLSKVRDYDRDFEKLISKAERYIRLST